MAAKPLVSLAFRFCIQCVLVLGLFLHRAPVVRTGSPQILAPGIAARGIAFGETVGGSIDLATESDAYAFAAEAGDRVLVAATKTSGDLWPQLRVYAPGGVLLFSDDGTTRAEIEGELPSSGTYTILVDDGFTGSLTGAYNLHVQRLNDPGAATPITFGATLDGAIDSVGSFKAYTIAAYPGDTLLVAATKTSGGLWPEIRVFDSAGHYLAQDGADIHSEITVTLVPEFELFVPMVLDGAELALSAGAASPSGNAMRVRQERRVTVLVNSGFTGALTGTYNLHVQRLNAPGAATPASFGGTIGDGAVPIVGETDAYTFTAGIGDTVLVAGTKVSGGLWPHLRLYDPEGRLLNEDDADVHAEITQTLTTYGVHTILVDSGFTRALTGTYSLYLQQLDGPAAVTEAPFGETMSGREVAPVGATETFTFTAEAGDTVLVAATKTSGALWPHLRLYDAMGRLLTYDEADIHAEITATLSTTGPHTILVDSGFTRALTGTYSLYLQRLNEPGNATPLAAGQVVTGTVMPVGEMDTYTMDVNAGSLVIVSASKVAGGLWPHIRLYDPEGRLLNEDDADTHAELSQVLPTSGDHTLLVDSGSTRALTGTYTIQFQSLE